MPLVAALAIAAAGCDGDEEAEPVTPPVENPAQARTLAGRYAPDLMLERRDGFWPVSVRTIDLLSGDRGPCLALRKSAPCDPIATLELPWDSGPATSYIDYPAANKDRDAQHDAFVRALGADAPGSKAQLYFYVTGRKPNRPVSLQYWFYYPFNYLQLHLPFGRALNTDLHEGDFEGMGMLLSARKHKPVYVWMPRHTGEGERFAWNQGALQRHGGHPLGFVAKGSHATYESCGRKFRTAFALGSARDIPDDFVSCDPGDTYELGATIPAVNMARTWWACWPGHFGYAPGYGSRPVYGGVLSQIAADGPLSPLFQQKFDLGKPRPCDRVGAPAPPQGSGEVLPDPDTATALGASGGRLNDLFRSCEDWSQRPPEGSYMVACDPATLERFFESGLEDPGQQDLRVLGDPAPTGPTVPAVFASSDPGAVDRATIRARELAHPEVYVAVRSEEKLATAEFPPFTLSPGQRLRLERGSASEWSLVDLAAEGRTVARAPVRVSGAGISPRTPAIVSAVRRGAQVDLRFSGDTDPATRMAAFAGTSRGDLIEGGRFVGAVRGEASGDYELTVSDPERELRFVRVVASRDGALAASKIAAVSEAS